MKIKASKCKGSPNDVPADNRAKDWLRAVRRSIKALAPDVITTCQCSIASENNNLISAITKPLRFAGETSLFKIVGKHCTIVHAFHPSIFSKNIRDGPLPGPRAVYRAALLELSFLRAVNALQDTQIVGYELDKLRNAALNVNQMPSPSGKQKDITNAL